MDDALPGWLPDRPSRRCGIHAGVEPVEERSCLLESAGHSAARDAVVGWWEVGHRRRREHFPGQVGQGAVRRQGADALDRLAVLVVLH
jgi:hypothetical protein